jgi:hypothetical protein
MNNRVRITKEELEEFHQEVLKTEKQETITNKFINIMAGVIAAIIVMFNFLNTLDA